MRRWLATCALAACASPVETSSQAQAVTNATPDHGDPAVVGLVDQTDQLGCTASIIGPHTAITAAHCIGTSERKLRAFFGADAAIGGTFIAVSDARMHPLFDPGGHDIAMLTLREEAPVTPLALERAAAETLDGSSIRVVGYGITGGQRTDEGMKREGTARIAAVQAEEFITVPDPSLSCNGDSGGPALLPAGTIAGVVSRGDSRCNDHAVYSRVDIARADLIDPYIAETAPGTASVGERCLYEGQCDGGPCLQAHDDPELYFCSRACERDADCPSEMSCAVDGCRYPEPSPGALGSPCDGDDACTSHVCRDQVCTRNCLQEACPTDFECRGSDALHYCFPADSGCGCSSGGGGSASLVVIGLVLFAGRARRAGRRGG